MFQERHRESGTTPMVCGETLDLGECQASATWEEASATCSAVGSRLCTVSELQQDAAQGSGCGFDFMHVWTSDTCNSGARVLAGGSSKLTGSMCAGAAAVAPVRCCADAINVDRLFDGVFDGVMRIDYNIVKAWMEEPVPALATSSTTPEPARQRREDDPIAAGVPAGHTAANVDNRVVAGIGGVFLCIVVGIITVRKWNQVSSSNESDQCSSDSDGGKGGASVPVRRRQAIPLDRSNTNDLENAAHSESETDHDFDEFNAELSLLTALRGAPIDDTGGKLTKRRTTDPSEMSQNEIDQLLQFGLSFKDNLLAE